MSRAPAPSPGQALACLGWWGDGRDSAGAGHRAHGLSGS